MSTSQTPDDLDSDRANRVPWPPILLVDGVLAAWLAGRYAPLAWPGTDDLAARVVGIGFGVAGAALIAWAVITMRRANTTIMPHGRSDHLVTTGPFARFRNPIYLGDTLLFLFLAEITKNFYFVVAAVLFVILVTALQIIPEERHLKARFGEAYETYRARSRRWI